MKTGLESLPVYRRARARLARLRDARRARAAAYSRSWPALRAGLNQLEAYAGAFDGIEPWSGRVPRGYMVDFTGTLTNARYRLMVGDGLDHIFSTSGTTRLPTLVEDREGWFEAVNWVIAASEARGCYRMITLGACYGAQAVCAYRIMQQVNPMPCTLIAVEPVPENLAWTAAHFRDNGIDPDRHWLVPHAISGDNEPVLFPVGGAGTGAQNCISTNHVTVRQQYLEQFINAGQTDMALRNLLLHNTTGLSKNVTSRGQQYTTEVKLVSAITLKDLLGPFPYVDYVESDIQQSEINAFPRFIDLLRQKVRRIHIGTHGIDTHRTLHELFERNGWEMVFSYEPDTVHETQLGRFATNDGVLTVRNPDL